jgi:MFS family permease
MSDSAQNAGQQAPRIVLFGLPHDGIISFATRIFRMFSYGTIAPVIMLYLIESGLTETEAGALLTSILIGDIPITLYLSTRADSFGRRKTLVIGSILKLFCGITYASTSSFPLLVIAGTLGGLCICTHVHRTYNQQIKRKDAVHSRCRGNAPVYAFLFSCVFVSHA